MSQKTPSPKSTRRPPAWRKALLAGHITVSVGMIGAALVLAALGVSGLRGADPVVTFQPAHLVESWVIIPLAVLALATGVTQAYATGRGLFAQRWVTIKLGITIATTAAVILVLEPRLAASVEGALAGATFADSQRMGLVMAPLFAAALLVLNVILGVYKPGRRVPRHRPPS